MDIDIKDTITLSDNSKYLVISKVNYKHKSYYYLINESNNNIKFCFGNDECNSIVEIIDENLIKKLIPLFIKSTIKVEFN